jgi:hypothetical protein
MFEVAPDYLASPTKVRMLMLSGVIEKGFLSESTLNLKVLFAGKPSGKLPISVIESLVLVLTATQFKSVSLTIFLNPSKA